MRSDFLNSILIPVQCDPIRPPRACLLTLLVAHITGTFYQTKLSVHSLWLLFQVDVYILLYVNDIYRCSEQLSFILFADDTNIFYQHKDINVLIETLNNELKKVNLWLQANKLSLNIKKTHDIIFKTRRNKIDNKIVKINDTEIKQVESTKFLRIYIDSNLTWKTHIKHITTKIAKTTGILFKARHFLPSQTPAGRGTWEFPGGDVLLGPWNP